MLFCAERVAPTKVVYEKLSFNQAHCTYEMNGAEIIFENGIRT